MAKPFRASRSHANLSPDAPYLYLLMRTDLASLNPGKAVAQGAHAATKATWLARKSRAHARMLADWEAQTGQGYGVKVSLGVDENTMRRKVAAAKRLGLLTSVLHDPSYPLQDGATLHLIPLDTCAFVFGPRDAVGPLVADLQRMP